MSRAAAAILAAWVVTTLAGGAPPELHFDRIGAVQGLDAENITALRQDRAGFLWIGSREGLVMYDGYTFTRFEHDASDPHSISDNAIRTIYEDRDGRLWIGTNTGGLNLMDRARWSFEAYRADASNPGSLSHDSVYAIEQDRTGALWVGTQDGLNRLDPATGRFERFLVDPARGGGLGPGYVTSLLEDRAGGLWVGTFGGGLLRRDPGSGEFQAYRNDPRIPASLDYDRIFALAQDGAGGIWVGTARSLDRLDPASGTFRHVDLKEARDAGVSSLAVDGSGTVWAGTLGKGLVVVDAAHGDTRVYRRRPDVDDSLSGDRISALACGEPARVWIGTWGAGADEVRLDAESFRALRARGPDPNGLSHSDVTAVLEDTTGRLLVGTFGGGVDVGSTGESRFRPLPAPGREADSATVVSMAAARGATWVGTTTGLLELDPKGRRLATFRHDPGSSKGIGPGYVTALHQDREGRLWVGTGGGGLHRLAASGDSFERFVHDPGNAASLSDDYVAAVGEQRDGTLWVGTRSGGLNRFDRATRTFERFAPDPKDDRSLSHHYVTAILEDSHGRLWVGTGGGGLDRADRDGTGRWRFTRFTDRDGLLDNNVMAIVEDDDGSLWLGTRRGLARFDPERRVFATYGIADGLPGSEFNVGAVARGAHDLYLGTTKGAVVIARGSRFPNPGPAPTRVTSIRTLAGPLKAERPAWELDEIRLPYGDVLFLDFAVLDFREQSRHRYAYRLDEKDRDWIDLTNRRQIVFTGLAPGSHTLHVRGRSAAGVWSEAAPAVSIVVVPPIWMTTWFRALLAALLACAVLAWVSLRTRRLERRHRQLLALKEELQAAYDRLRKITRRLEAAKEDERKHIARELHDEMGQALTAAKINLQLVSAIDDPDKKARRIAETVELVNRMIEHVRALSLDLRPPLLDELGLVAALRGYVEAVAQRTGLRIAVESDALPPGTQPELEIVAFRVVQEALTNVVRHASARNVAIEIRVPAGGSALRIEVRDDGAGFDVREALERAAGGQHLGLIGILERIRGLAGEAEIDSAPGRGTSVRVSVPLTH